MSSWEDLLTQAGNRITAARRAVMGVLQAADQPLSPHELYEQGRAHYRALGLVTVYRTLELLEQFQLVERVYQEDGGPRYLATTPGHRHVIVCQSCRRAVEFLGCDHLKPLIAHVEGQTGYQVDTHLLQLSGHCPACRPTT